MMLNDGLTSFHTRVDPRGYNSQLLLLLLYVRGVGFLVQLYPFDQYIAPM
jgi:hypothetical protein